MSAYTERQYRPLSTLETAADDGLSVRINDLADGLNNYNRWAGRHKILGQPFLPYLPSPAAGTTDETVVAMFAPRLVPDGFDKLSWACGHYRTNGAGSVIWRMYCHEFRYWGDVVLDANKLSQGYSVSTCTTSSGTHAVSVQTDLPVVRGLRGYAWLVLTAENQDGSTDAAMTSIDAWPVASN